MGRQAGDNDGGADAGAASRSGEATHILLVDREQDTRDLLGMILRVSGYRVSTAATAAAARDRLDEELPDIVLLDLPVVPDPAEVEVARSLSAEPASAVKVVLHTSLAEDAASERFARYDAFLRKPAPVEQIVETVDAALHGGD